MQILAISGSLRAVSSNSAVLRAIRMLAPRDIEVTIFAGLGELPHFNPDLDGDQPPEPVQHFRAQVVAADGLLISSPEYARGVPGSLKNGLDWLVGALDFQGKPVALINTSPRAIHAYTSLKTTLETMAACFIPEASVIVPLLGKTLDAEGIAADPECAAILREAIDAFARGVSMASQREHA
jgi:NAD(P)H-dependent FMN reductase